MDFPLNPAQPRLMHIDLNACFAMTEQQANPLLRGRPVAVTNRLSSGAIIVSPSYEAKRCGIRCGTRVDEAYRLAPNLVVLETDPAKYSYVHHAIKQIFSSYTPNVTMKSIDEGVLDFAGMDELLGERTLVDIGYEIKARVAEELGSWMTVNVGIGTNRFTAKLASGLDKPNGLDILTDSNLEIVYAFLELTDLPGINRRYAARLMINGITNPIEFLLAPEQLLSKQVFKSINGRHWYLRLRGYEVDDYPTRLKTVGKQFVLRHFTSNSKEIAQVVHEMAIQVGRRLRRHDLGARGLFVGADFIAPQPMQEGLSRSEHWHRRELFPVMAWRGDELYRRAMYLLADRPREMRLKTLVMSTYGLEAADTGQMTFEVDSKERDDRLEEAINKINDNYGELTVAPAALLKTKNRVSQKNAFGSTRYF